METMKNIKVLIHKDVLGMLTEYVADEASKNRFRTKRTIRAKDGTASTRKVCGDCGKLDLNSGTMTGMKYREWMNCQNERLFILETMQKRFERAYAKTHKTKRRRVK